MHQQLRAMALAQQTSIAEIVQSAISSELELRAGLPGLREKLIEALGELQRISRLRLHQGG